MAEGAGADQRRRAGRTRPPRTPEQSLGCGACAAPPSSRSSSRAYAATLGLDAFGDSDYGGDEPHYLLAAESIDADGDVDVNDEYAARAYADFYPYELDKHGTETEGRLNEPHGVGFPLLIAPAYAIGGAQGRGAVPGGDRRARRWRSPTGSRCRWCPTPGPSAPPRSTGLSPPFLAYGTAVYPELTAGAALAGAALLALRLEERISGATPSSASPCSASCPGSAPSSCPRAS